MSNASTDKTAATEASEATPVSHPEPTDSTQPAAAANDVRQTTIVEHSITDDLDKLLAILPTDLCQKIEQHPQKADLVEVIMDLGRKPEIRFPNGAEDITEAVITHEQLQESIAKVGDFGGDNRAGIERTLHRISAMRNRRGDVIGLTCRVGRAVFGTVGMIRDLVESGQSILMLGRPGVGKTTALREIARVLADDLGKRVVIIDSSNEIAGDGDVPHPAIGRARRMQVARPELQHQVMIEAVENHMPEVIVIDEIGTELEALAARTIAERGVQLVGTAHGNYLDNLIKNPTLSDLVGGIQSVTLGDEEARRRGSQKSVLERKALPTFEIAVEMQERQKWVVHPNVAKTIDILLRGLLPSPEVRSVEADGKVAVAQIAGSKTATPPNKGRRVVPLGGQVPLGGPMNHRSATPIAQAKGWRASGRMVPPTADRSMQPLQSQAQIVPSAHTLGLRENANGILDNLPNSETNPLYVYPYGIGRHQLEQAIVTLELPILLTKDLDSADVVLALRSHVKNHTKLRHLANARQIPIHTLKSNSMPQIAQGLRRLMQLDEEGLDTPPDLSLFTRGESDDELEALEEARLAVEQIVIPKGQPVELLPRAGLVRKMQHELVERYRLKSSSFGTEPNRRIRIYPA
ncbi:AAA family ATPase [filamentous cyanobacterium LEGE 11480]|uniref:AAA family ATPase n=2 Tax=Romeriopsis TaxID=2992131 RepID=A0A928VPY3_9CYAN|nr:AAA family ATPase [Romeriopsis navalis LEGE 11480]